MISNRVGYSPAVRQVTQQRQNVAFGAGKRPSFAIMLGAGAMIAVPIILGSAALRSCSADRNLPRVEKALNDTVEAAQLRQNYNFIKGTNEGFFSQDRKEYLDMFEDSALKGGSSTPNTAFAEKIKVGSIKAKIQHQIDSLEPMVKKSDSLKALLLRTGK